MPITLNARRNFVHHCTLLSIWLARRLSQEGIPFRQAVTTKTNVYRFTNFWDGKNHPADDAGFRDPQWESLLDGLDAINARHPAGDATAELEAESLALLWPHMEPRLQQDVDAWPKPADKPFGFFNYRPHDEEWDLGKVVLHLSNPFAPASPFDDLNSRARELANLLQHALAHHPNRTTVHLQSWLAAFPPLQTLFPAEFATGASTPRRLAYHLGWWGQMIDRNGDFHHKHGQHLRTTGQFRYPNIICTASIPATLAHLKKHFGAG